MPAIAGTPYFGTDPEVFLSPVNIADPDYLYRELRAGQYGVDITTVEAEIDPGAFIRSAGNAAIVNGGAIQIARLAILRGSQGKKPPAPNIFSGALPYGYRINDLIGWEFLYQATIYAWPQQVPHEFVPLRMMAKGDHSLYVIIGAPVIVIAGTVAAPGTVDSTINALAGVTLSIAGTQYDDKSATISADPRQRSLPKWDIAMPGQE